VPLAWYGLYRVGYQENTVLKNIYLEIHVQGNMDAVEQFIDWHYSDPGSDEKASLLNHLQRAWKPLSDDKLHKNLDKLLTDENNAQCILYFTMRNRKLLEKVNISAGLRQFLKHLDEQGKNPFLEDASIKAMQRHTRYCSKRNFMTALQIERVRRIRANARTDNFHRQFCHRILASLEVEECEEKFTGIHVSSRGLEGLIALQKALTFAGTADHTSTLELANDAEKCFNEAKSRLHPGLWDLLIWWVYEMKARIYSRWLMKEERAKWKKKLEHVTENCEDPVKKEYMDKLKTTGESFVGIPVLMDAVFFGIGDAQDLGKNKINSKHIEVRLHMAHALLSKFINPEKEKGGPQIGATFRKEQILNMLGIDSKDIQRTALMDREQKKRMNELLLSGILGVVKKTRHDHRPEPLIYDPHSIDTEKQLKSRIGKETGGPYVQAGRRKRMFACCSSAQYLIQSAQERNVSWLPLQLTLVLIDLLVKIRYLGGFTEKIAKKRDGRMPISDEDATSIYKGIAASFQACERALSSFKHAKKSPLFLWIQNITRNLNEWPADKISISNITLLCQNAVSHHGDIASQGGIKLHHLSRLENGTFETKQGEEVPFCTGYNNEWTPYAKTPGEGKFRA